MSQFDQKFLDSDLNIKDEWETPRWLYAQLGALFHFSVDAAANSVNTKRQNHFWTIEDDGLEQDWEGEVVFCNPPFTDGKYSLWIEKATDAYLLHGTTTVMVLPFKPETKGFNDVWKFARYIVMPYKRIKFYPPESMNIKKPSAPTFYSCIVVWGLFDLEFHELKRLSRVGRVLDLHRGLFRA